MDAPLHTEQVAGSSFEPYLFSDIRENPVVSALGNAAELREQRATGQEHVPEGGNLILQD